MKERCRNCGLQHNTRTCPSWGPMFPAPGKTAADYAEVAKKIADRVAADIVAEHNGEETEEGGPIVVKKVRKKANRAVAGDGKVGNPAA
jgi:hypothetical protein